jgi:hypothetical protein
VYENFKNNSKTKTMKPTELKLGELYQVYDDGICMWDYEFIGYDVNESEYVFRAIESPMSMSFGFFRIEKSELETLVRPNSMKGIGRDDLRLGDMYSIIDYDSNEWIPEYEYLGYDSNTNDHMFRNYDGSMFSFIGVSEDNLGTDVKLDS